MPVIDDKLFAAVYTACLALDRFDHSFVSQVFKALVEKCFADKYSADNNFLKQVWSGRVWKCHGKDGLISSRSNWVILFTAAMSA